ncbi:hypothetical protein CPB83DRAFT_860137 [Crepidotus variabilis]|uniref:DUF6533 domain-containing protein n=1 Tax=Crepidotus variabilis TaxID=179855 RepID=A0A9P6JLN4_9AGAR|nr:hypothetical protein CPB83DRAFT_860137 [Crepidotus variabilis]
MSTNAAASRLMFEIQYASLTVLYYDYALTLRREIKYIWRTKLNLSTLLYVFCRYAMVANVIYTLAYAGKLKTMKCDSAYQLSAALSVLGRIGILTVWGIRTSAIFHHRNKFIIGFFGALGLVVVVLSAQHVPYVACSKGRAISTVPAEVPALLTALYEVLSVILATFQCIKLLKSAGPLRYQKHELVYFVMQQGLLYFALISILAFGNLVLLYIPSIKGTWFERSLNALNIPLSGTMTARYLLHLREWGHAKAGSYHSNLDDSMPPLTEVDLQSEPLDSTVFTERSGSDVTGRGWMATVINDSLFTTGELERLDKKRTTEEAVV